LNRSFGGLCPELVPGFYVKKRMPVPWGLDRSGASRYSQFNAALTLVFLKENLKRFLEAERWAG
jgi:hypothetical protein